MSVRPYDNTNRAQKSLKTRDAIIKTMIAEMANGGEDISVAQVAKQSGVSLRTVYQHFPDKSARIQGINAWINENVEGDNLLPENFDDLPNYIERRVDYILQNETIIRAQMASGLSKDVRSFRKLSHAKHLRKALREKLNDKKSIEELVALIISAVRAEAILDMRDIYKMPVPRIKARLSKMIELTINEAVARN